MGRPVKARPSVKLLGIRFEWPRLVGSSVTAGRLIRFPLACARVPPRLV
jgi:hypothetical protein